MAQGAQQGQSIDGRYRLVRSLGTGGMGRVWEAHDERLDTRVAVKELWLPPALSAADRAERLQRAEREALNAVRLRDHPNIVTVHDVVIEDAAPWIVMELVTGGTLQERLKQGPLSPEAATRVATGLLKALEAAHGRGVVHRDVKPANVMVTQDRRILLTDFGIAVHRSDPNLTATGVVIGSAPYLSPERVRGERGGAAGDLFSLGTTLYEAVEGVGPFHRVSTAAALHAVVYEEPPAPRRAERLTDLITALLAKDPADRPSIPQAQGLLKKAAKSAKKPVAESGSGASGSGAGSSGAGSSGQKSPGAKGSGAKGSGAKSSGAKNPGPAGPAPAPTPKPKPKPKPKPVAAPKPVLKPTPTPSAGTSAGTSTSSGSAGTVFGWLVVIALVLLGLYSENESFADWVSADLNGDIASAQVDDCVHLVEQDEDHTAQWVRVPCWSAATRFSVRQRKIGQVCETDPLWKNGIGDRRDVYFKVDQAWTGHLCVMPK
ncbi:serine/threonine-protein kinase [Streptomyces sp. NPDC052114]|uniref:serine/threonine-protein kinase n=1 Tax=unclassified Streptomyces TaxID=2593676 RepID=UPI0034305770